MKTLIFSTFLALLAFPTFGNEAPVEQTTCPVMVGNPIDPSLHVDYDGQRVYFCCKQCVKLFSENPEEYLHNLPQFASAKAAHDHETDHHGGAKPNRLVSYLGKFHPVAVHLPIALVLGAALAELLYMLSWNVLFRNAAVFNLMMAVLGAAAAVPLGLAAASGTDYPADYAQVLSFHKWLGIATMLFIAVAAALAVRANRKDAGKRDQRPYRLVLLICVGLVGMTGHLGGLLVYGLKHFSW
jgi:uncharacterized membrane protein/YHS domain-containing protein